MVTTYAKITKRANGKETKVEFNLSAQDAESALRSMLWAKVIYSYTIIENKN